MRYPSLHRRVDRDGAVTATSGEARARREGPARAVEQGRDGRDHRHAFSVDDELLPCATAAPAARSAAHVDHVTVARPPSSLATLGLQRRGEGDLARGVGDDRRPWTSYRHLPVLRGGGGRWRGAASVGSRTSRARGRGAWRDCLSKPKTRREDRSSHRCPRRADDRPGSTSSAW